MADNPIINCVDVTHIYPRGNIMALKNLDLQIDRAEIVGVIGQNGSGKTTMVKHLNALLKPTSGTVYIDGESTANQKVQKLAKTVGYVYQNPNHQLFARTVQDELEFGPRNLGLDEDEVAARRDEAIEFFGLQDLRELHPYRIGFPLRKLVGMASVYTMQPAVFILDEPTTGQDNITTQRVYKLIQRLRERGHTVICVSHDMILLAEVVDRLLVMRDAELIADDEPRKVFAMDEIMRSTHLLPPQITQLSLRLAKGKQTADDVVLSVDEMVQRLSK